MMLRHPTSFKPLPQEHCDEQPLTIALDEGHCTYAQSDEESQFKPQIKRYEMSEEHRRLTSMDLIHIEHSFYKGKR
jgi:hypothetical protein